MILYFSFAMDLQREWNEYDDMLSFDNSWLSKKLRRRAEETDQKKDDCPV